MIPNLERYLLTCIKCNHNYFLSGYERLGKGILLRLKLECIGCHFITTKIYCTAIQWDLTDYELPDLLSSTGITPMRAYKTFIAMEGEI